MDNWAAKVSDLEGQGWSLTALGKAIGLSPQAVSDIKQGRTKAPSGMAAVRLHEIHQRIVLPAANDDTAAAEGEGAL
ncbi:helix-turn-helix transcriptional regulator [uncultured Luteimonas sp.]|uniref:helix-turn-helix domain-containing protein n=1 Tax=uncultured Luteimonas sp. TaxID=453144 RepID=UPI00262B7003|nr:helix-turn-helix transcriptional regulator [uncultured Luteimonas sp.]